MNKVYVKFNAANQFDGFHLLFQDDALPENAFIIDGDQHDEYLNALNSQLKNIILVDGEIQIVDKYTPEELEAKQALEAKQREMSQAKTLLNQSIKLESGVYQRRMSETEQMEFIRWQDALLEFINGEREEIPPTPEFINILLGA